MIDNWNIEEINILLESHEKRYMKGIMRLIPNKTEEQIREKLKELKVSPKEFQYWNEEEIELLRKIFRENEKVTTQALKKYFPYRNLSSLKGKCKSLGLQITPSIKIWSKEEEEVLLEYNGLKTLDQLAELLPHLTKTQISDKARSLNVKILPRLFELCQNCDEENDRPTWKICSFCHNAQKSAKRYFKIYGIRLDSKKFYDTYDIIQWFKWTSTEKTPYNKYLSKLPPILKTEKNYAKIWRYIAIEALGVSSKKDLHKITRQDFVEHGADFTISETQKRYPLYTMLSLAFPEWDLSEKEFELNIAFDGTYLDSKIELKIYELLKRDLKLKVRSTNYKDKIINKDTNEGYIPDFILKHKNKKYIIEYFGLYHDNPKAEYLIKYRDKTKRKIMYYESLGIPFISFYREDTSNNFEGIKSKLESYKIS